jgi:hypothetical protein
MIDHDFEMAYTVELVEDLTREDESERLFFPPSDGRGGGDGVSLRVRSATKVWTGTFAFGYPDPRALTRIFAFPSPDHVCVVSRGAGYVVDAAQPRDWYRIEAFPIYTARSAPSRSLLLFADFTTIAAYGPSGLVWKTERLSWDGLRLTEITDDYAWASAWDTEKEVSVRIDLRDGKAEGGTRPELP